jgi:MSHA pilin protein MshD
MRQGIGHRRLGIGKSRCPLSTSQSGVTLVELVISIVVVSIAVSAILGVLAMLSTGSADAMIRHQAVAIGNAYLEEALLKPFNDPDGADGEGSRAEYDDLDDYNGLDDNGAEDQFGNTLGGLSQYRVTMTVGDGTLGSLSAASEVRRIDVTVSHPAGVAMTFSGYRTNY